MWYNLDKSFPAPATYFDMNSHLPDLIQPPKVAFEDKEQSAPIVWVLSNCGAFNGREKFVEKLMKLIPIHSYGNCLNNRDTHSKKRMDGKNFYGVLILPWPGKLLIKKSTVLNVVFF